MASELPGGLRQVVMVVNSPHVHRGIAISAGFRVILIVVGDKAQKIFEATFLKQPHQTFEEQNKPEINKKQALQNRCSIQPTGNSIRNQ